MSTPEQEPNIRLLTEDQIYEQTGGGLGTESLLRACPEVFNAATERYLGIFNQLSGQAKADFFHMRHFRIHDDQSQFWAKLAEADPEAAEWHENLLEARANAFDELRQKEFAKKNMGCFIRKQAAAQLETHPFNETDRECISAEFKGTLKGRETTFWISVIGKDSPEEKSRVLIDVPQEPTHFNVFSDIINPITRRKFTPSEGSDFTLVSTGFSFVVEADDDTHVHKVIDRSDNPTTGQKLFQEACNNRHKWSSYPYELSSLDLKIDSIGGEEMFGHLLLDDRLADLTLDDVLDFITNAAPVESPVQ